MSEIDIFMHEVKNSLSNIYLLVELMESNIDEYGNCLPLIKESIEQIKNVEADYIQYRNLGKNQISRELVNIASLVNAIVAEYRTMAENKNIKIDINCTSIKLTTDETKLRQVLSNLLSNAIKYTLPGGRVLIECNKVKSVVYISVKDTGIGMNATEIAKLGTAFYRCKKIEAPGTGLGWTLIKSISDLMNWNIKVISGKPPFEHTTQVTVIL